jgi:serine/threonine protein kinase
VDSPETLLVPSADTLVLGRYRLHERLGAGGFGVVWSAYDEQLHREVAVKRIWLHTDGRRQRDPRSEEFSTTCASHSLAERASREAQATARLAHPAIVALYEAQAEGEAFYLISELVQGDTLGAVLAEGELSDEEILAIGVALAGALEHAHARGVIHRDVKPHNILVPHDPVERAVGVAKLTDFGGALLAGEDVLTRTGDVLGTLAYMAPEQSEGREASGQTDLYSLALVLYEALAGVNPVRGANPAETARRIGGRLPPLRRYRRDLPRDLTQVLDTALAPTPQQRG